jgi:HSP20 family protein
MVISRWDPWSELAALQRDVDELFGRGSQGSRRQSSLVPPMDAFRNDDGSLTIRLELPGVRPEDISVNYQRGVLTVTGERKSEHETRGDNWLRRERAVGSFSRSVTLSEHVDASQITANFEHGVLELRVPQAPEERTTRIPVAGGRQAEGQTVEVEGTTSSSSPASGQASGGTQQAVTGSNSSVS